MNPCSRAAEALQLCKSNSANWVLDKQYKTLIWNTTPREESIHTTGNEDHIAFSVDQNPDLKSSMINWIWQ